MPIERHALYFYNVASTSTSTSEQASTSAAIATCTCRIHVPVTSVAEVASSSKNLGKSPMVTWKLAAPSVKSIAGQQYELGYPVPAAGLKGDNRQEPPWTHSKGSITEPTTPCSSTSTSTSSSPSVSPMSRSSSSTSIASLAHSEVSTISSYTSCSSLLDMEDPVSVQPQTAFKKPLPSPSCERPPSAIASPILPTTAAAVIVPPPAAQLVLDSILVAQTVQRRSAPHLAPTSKGMPFIPEDIGPKSPTLATMPDVFEMNSRTATLLRIDGFKARIGAILEDLEIFPQARKDFMDYWYTRFKDQEYLAVRFLTSKDYATLLPLHITSSSPYTIQRLFAIFKRVTHDEAKHWFSSRLRIDSQMIDWKERVGLTVSGVVPKPRASSTSEERRRRRSANASAKESWRRVHIDTQLTETTPAVNVKASLLELGAMELSVEAGIGRFFFV